MARLSRAWIAPALVLAAIVCGGCDLGTMAYFLLPEAKVQPECKSLAPTDKKKESRVVILAYAPQLDLDAVQADRQLAELLAKHLHEQYEKNEENVTLIPPRKVEEFKASHPEWTEMPPEEIGRQFKADYVISLEINSLSLYEKGSHRTMYRGRIDINVTLVDIAHPDDPEHKEFQGIFPSEARVGVEVDSGVPPLAFRLKFLDNVAKHLTRYFAAISPRQIHDLD